MNVIKVHLDVLMHICWSVPSLHSSTD